MSGTPVNESKLCLKILVDTKARKVVFAEAREDFVDFIFNLLTLPLASVVKLLKDEGMRGCLGSVYNSIDSLNAKYFKPGTDKDCVLKPKIAITNPLLSLNEMPTRTKLFKCPHHNRFSFQEHQICSGLFASSCFLNVEGGIYVNVQPNSAAPKFVKADIPYMVMDDLEVKPMSISVFRACIDEFRSYEEQVVEFGVNEAVKLLKASLETNDVLTTVFLAKSD